MEYTMEYLNIVSLEAGYTSKGRGSGMNQEATL